MRFLKNIKRVLEWLPILWQDRDYDYSYILKLLHYKLERTKKCIVSNNIIVEADKVAEEITDTQECIQKALDSQFDDEWYEHFKTEHMDVLPHGQCPDCRFLLDVATSREETNWAEIWLNMMKYAKGWWD